MKYRNTPPIQLMPVFEAAARHCSFKRAAEELCVTAPAVGQQIRVFEQWLGKPLFLRHARALSLTPEGEYYYEVARQLIEKHTQGYNDYQRIFEQTSVALSATFFVAQELLMPNYLKFSEYAPGVELRVETRMSYVDFDRETLDAAIRFGDGHWPQLNSHCLSRSWLAPVCSAEYLKQNPIGHLSQLHEHRLIYASPEMAEWGSHFYGDEIENKYPPIICDSYIAALKAAESGQGVALGIFPITQSWLKEKRLVLVEEIKIDVGKGYYLVWPKTGLPEETVQALLKWTQSIFSNC